MASQDSVLAKGLSIKKSRVILLQHRRRLNNYDKTVLHSIIFFQYQLSKNADVDDKKKMEEKILSILSDPKATFDPDHALILSQMHGFSRGTLFLYEKKGLHDQVQFEKVLVVQL